MKKNRSEMVEKVLNHPLFDTDLKDEPKTFNEKGAFHSGRSSCFSDSEQAFLTFLEQPADRFIVRSRSNNTQKISGVEAVNIRLLSTRDICKFCRGTLAFSMSNTWLKDILGKFLNKQNIETVSELKVGIIGYSMCPTSSERS